MLRRRPECCSWSEQCPSERPAVKGLIDHEPMGYLKVSDPFRVRDWRGAGMVGGNSIAGAVFEGTTGSGHPLLSAF